jgi:hypothetical protein
MPLGIAKLTPNGRNAPTGLHSNGHLCSAITRSRRRGRRQTFVMRATRHRFDAHPKALADPTAGQWYRGHHRGKPHHHRRYVQDCTARADCLTLRIRHPHADFQSNGEVGSVRVRRRPGTSFRGADRTAPPDRAHTEPEARKRALSLQRPNALNELPASRPNLFRTAHRAGPARPGPPSTSPPRDPPPPIHDASERTSNAAPNRRGANPARAESVLRRWSGLAPSRT